MATSSFSKPLVINSDAAAAVLLEASKADCNTNPIKRLDIMRELESGRSFLKKIYSR